MKEFIDESESTILGIIQFITICQKDVVKRMIFTEELIVYVVIITNFVANNKYVLCILLLFESLSFIDTIFIGIQKSIYKAHLTKLNKKYDVSDDLSKFCLLYI